jgi:hypothetical protein
MSTRACIAKPDGDGWRGRYHHSDGYPTGLGVALMEHYNGYFQGDLDAMTTYLIDNEKVGWSFIHGTDLSLGPQWQEYDEYPKTPEGWTDYSAIGPQSYTARGETSDKPTGDWITHEDVDDVFIEWSYILTPRGIIVYYGTHTPLGMVEWDDIEGMVAMEAKGNEIGEALYEAKYGANA